jgi:hypothetical protein
MDKRDKAFFCYGPDFINFENLARQFNIVEFLLEQYKAAA